MQKRYSRRLAFIYSLLLVSSSNLPVTATEYATTSSNGLPPLGQFSITINDEMTNAAEPVEAEESLDGVLSAWSLPITGPLVGSEKKNVKVQKQIQPVEEPVQEQKELAGSISFSDPYDKFTAHVDKLMDAAMERDADSAMLDQKVKHYRKKTQIVIAESKDATNYLIPFRGFGPSSEAGDIILGEKLKIKSRAAAEYARQKHVDEIHLKVVSNMMQVAMGLGMQDKERGATVAEAGMANLRELVGNEEAENTKAMLASMMDDVSIPDGMYERPTWDVQQKQTMHRELLQLSLEDDPVIHQITKQLHKYNHRSKFAMVSSQVVQTLLGAASLTPTFVGPAAKTALLAFVMATGGPEQCKLMKELYLDKRMESRWKVVNEEAHLAIDNYQLALLTKNPILLSYSESVVGQMVGGHNVEKVLGTSMIAHKKDGNNVAATTNHLM